MESHTRIGGSGPTEMIFGHVSLQSELVNRLQRQMAHNSISQEELAKYCGVPQGNISKILRGQRPNTTLATWDKLLWGVRDIRQKKREL